MGCSGERGADRVELVIGKRGFLPGQFVKPRAIAIDQNDNLFVVDMRAVIQKLSSNGEPLASWTTPSHDAGRPSGLCVDRDGNLVVADSHYHRILVYGPSGELIRSLGGDVGDGPLVGRFGYVADVAIDSKGYWYVAENQTHERITKIDPAGNIVGEWGGRGPLPGQLSRPRSLVFDSSDVLYVADACNHRVQAFDTEGRVLQVIGQPGANVGELDYPFDVAVEPSGHLLVLEYGNSRVQRFDKKGQSLGCWGRPGRGEGELWNPWAIAIDHQGRITVVDSNNHRLTRIRF